MPTIIDSLLVTLGLDTKGFKDGMADAEKAQDKLKASAQGDAKAVSDAHTKAGASAAKLGKARATEAVAEEKRQGEAARKSKQRSADQKKQTDVTIEGLKSIGLFAAGAVVGFETLKGAISAYANTAATLAGIGRLAPTVGASAEEVGILGNALKVVGGNADDATDALGKLGHAQFSLQNHAPDAMAGYLRRLGVSVFDAKGNPRDKLEILKDIGTKLRAMTNDQQTQAMYAREMGLSESVIQLYVLKQAAEREKILADAIKTNAATKEAADNAAKLTSAWSRLGNVVDGVKQKIVAATAAPLASLLNSTVNFLEADPHTVGLGAGKNYRGKDAPYRSAFAAAEQKYGLPAGLLAGVASKESNFNPNAQAKRNGAVAGQG